MCSEARGGAACASLSLTLFSTGLPAPEPKLALRSVRSVQAQGVAFLAKYVFLREGWRTTHTEVRPGTGRQALAGSKIPPSTCQAAACSLSLVHSGGRIGRISSVCLCLPCP